MTKFRYCFCFILFNGLFNFVDVSMGVNTKFTKYLRYEYLDGLVCTSDFVMLNSSASTWVKCLLHCKHTDLCFGVFYNQQDNRCTGCIYFSAADTLSEDGTKFYGRLGYVISSEKLTWSQAKENCSASGGYLVSINSFREQQLVDQIINDSGVGSTVRLWIGGNDMAAEGTFLWEDGSAFSDSTFSNWGSEQPNNYNSQDCVDLYQSGGKWLWNDEDCDEKLISLCEIY